MGLFSKKNMPLSSQKIDFCKIDNWLKGNADRILNCSLQSPANETLLKELEKITEKPLPQDFKQLYFWHNGMTEDENCGSLFYGMDFLPIEKIIAEQKRRIGSLNQGKIQLRKADNGIDISNLFNPGWVCFGFDGAHTWLYLDLAPTDKGTVGQIIFIDDEELTGILVAQSTADFVADFVNDLENGLYHLQPDALSEGNHFLEPANEIDLVNWYQSKKWQR